MQMKNERITLSNYIDSLQARGRYSFTREEALTILGVSADAFRFAALRLLKKKIIIRPKIGFYVIVPAEYLEVGAPPADWFIDDLMKFCQQPYYVGLLSAASLYGAAHQQPQVFQVVTNKPLRTIEAGRSQIIFFTKKKIVETNYQPAKTFTGYMNISYPEITAFDLVRYIKAAGYLNNIATVLSELQESFDEKRFAQILETGNFELPDIQRLGYLLELVDAKIEIISLLKQYVQKRKPHAISLRAGKPFDIAQRNVDWRLYINEKVESDI